MALTAEEQLMLELINRARLDPAGEAARYGIDLNEGLAAGTVTATAKQALAPNDLLQTAASDHSLWMLAVDVFSHTGVGGSDPDDRMRTAGYVFSGRYGWGENLSWTGTTGTLDPAASIYSQHRALFLSEGHRTNILGENFREVGIAQEFGGFDYQGRTYSTSMVTQDYAYAGTDVFLTGVAYHDADGDAFYGIGEGEAGVTFVTAAASATTEEAGGYALSQSPATAVLVTVTPQGGAASVVEVDLSGGNVKLDIVDDSLFLTSGDLRLVSGIADAELLGVGAISLTGSEAANVLTGNSGDNALRGEGGNDSLVGGDGNDTIWGGAHYDTIHGGAGDDQVWGDNGRDLVYLGDGQDVFWDNGQNDINGRDTIYGGAGDDSVNGAGGADVIYGEAGNDLLVGGIGDDLIRGGGNYDTIYGGDGNDTVYGDNGRDLVYLGNGDDLFWDNGQNDSNGADRIYGGTGNDTVNGGGGNDVIYGEDGADSLVGGIGDDTIGGGGGNDTIRGADGNDRVWSYNGRDLVFLGNGDDVFWDNADTVQDSEDTIYGGSGNDTVNAALGDDLVFGEAGNDWLTGGVGNDTLWGGADADQFVFMAGCGADVVGDFTDDLDTLVIDDALWGGAALTVSEVLAAYGETVGADIVLDFGGTDRITLAGYTGIDSLADDLVII